MAIDPTLTQSAESFQPVAGGGDGGAGPERVAFPRELVRLSHTRIRILELVLARPRTVCEIARHLAINKSAVHKHLQRLVTDSALTRAEHGKWVYYRPAPGTARLLDLVGVRIPDAPSLGEAAAPDAAP